VVPQGLDVFCPVVLGGDFRSPLSVISLDCFWDLSLGDLMGKFVGNLCGSLGCDSPPKSMSKSPRFWGFLSSWVGSALGGISSIPPFWMSFGGIKHGYGLRGAIREIGFWFWGS
jgi:hypothetical protein